MIYDKLGFKGDAYAPLYGSGGMTISNALSLQMDWDDQGIQERAKVKEERCD
jgi:hypothetical protein